MFRNSLEKVATFDDTYDCWEYYNFVRNKKQLKKLIEIAREEGEHIEINGRRDIISFPNAKVKLVLAFKADNNIKT